MRLIGRATRQQAAIGVVIAALVVLLAVIFVTLTYTRIGAELRKRELVVAFAPHTTAEQRLAARAACRRMPNATATPLSPGTLESGRINNVRFRIDNASSAQVAALEKCLASQPGVRGFSFPDDQ